MVWSSSRARNILNSSTPDNTCLITEGVLSSDQSSEGEFVEEEKPWPPLRYSRSRDKRQEPRPPRPLSHLFRTKDGRMRGSKHTRRWENSLYLSSLHGISEEKLDSSLTIIPAHNSPLTKLHTSDKHMQIWCSYTAATCYESTDQSIDSQSATGVRDEGDCVSCDHVTLRGDHVTGDHVRGEEAYRRIDRRIRSVLSHNKHIPMSLVEEVEQEMRELFSLDSSSVVVLLQTNAFCRLLLHGVCQYLGLISTTEVFKGVNLMIVECRTNCFSPPCSTLSQHYHYRQR